MNENGLRSKPVWSIEETGLQNELKIIQSQWKIILDESLAVLDFKSGGFTKYHEDINEGTVGAPLQPSLDLQLL